MAGNTALVTSLDDLSDVTYSSNNLTIASLDKIIFGGAVDFDIAGDVTFTENGAAYSFITIDYNQETLTLTNSATEFYIKIFNGTSFLTTDDVLRLSANKLDLVNSTIQMSATGGIFGWGLGGSSSYAEQVWWSLSANTYKFQNSNDSDDYFQFKVDSNAVTTLKTANDSGDTSANLVLDIDGDIELNADGGNITFKDNTADLAEISANGILSKTVVYFDAETANTIGNGATGVIDWTVNQKQKVTITGTGITCNFTNPPGPCNLMLKVIQGDGSDVIGTWDSDIKWPSNTPPTLSTANGAIDIISFYFDGTNYYGVGSLNFS